MLKKPHILYWKWNDDLLDKNILMTRTLDIIERSMFDVIYISLHSTSKENRLMSNPKILESVSLCSKTFMEHGRKVVLDVDIRKEEQYMQENPISEKSYLVKHCEGKLDDKGCFSKKIDGAEGVLFCKSLRFDSEGLFDESTVRNIKDKVAVSNETVYVNAGEDYRNSDIVFYVYKRSIFYDILGDEYKAKWETMCQNVSKAELGGIAVDEWGVSFHVDAPKEKNCGWDEISTMASEGKIDLDKIPFFIEWFVISDGLCNYYKKDFNADLIEDMLYFRNDSTDRQKGIKIVNQYIEALRKRTADGENFLYYMSKKYFGKDAIVLCHPTWWGDELDSNFDVPKNGLDWWEVKKDFAQTDELIPIPIRIARSRKCPENLWYNMWYSMRTLDINTYFRETWINARYGGRTHYLGYECYEPGVVLCLNQKDYLEKCSDMEMEIEKLNQFQTVRPDSKILIIFGYEAATNWKIADPTAKRWNRVSKNIHNVWKFTKELFDEHYLCELIPSSEIDNGCVKIDGRNISYCGHDYEMLICILPEGMSEKAQKLISDYGSINDSIMIIGNNVDFMKDVGLLNESGINLKNVTSVLKDRKIMANCGENYCVYEDGSVLYTTDGEKNTGNELKVNQVINGISIKFTGEDFLYVKPENGGFVTECGKCTGIDVRKV